MSLSLGEYTTPRLALGPISAEIQCVHRSANYSGASGNGNPTPNSVLFFQQIGGYGALEEHLGDDEYANDLMLRSDFEDYLQDWTRHDGMFRLGTILSLGQWIYTF
jgi:hypothetical protein